jgi:hypothetical protein
VGKREIVGLSAEKVPRIQCDGKLVTTLPWAIKGRRKSWERGDVDFREDEVLLDSVQNLLLGRAGRTREAAPVPRDARVLPAGLYLAADGVRVFAGPTVGANRVVTDPYIVQTVII